MDAAIAKLGPFDVAAWAWYWENASGWAVKAGIMAREFAALRLRGSIKSLFITAMNRIDEAIEKMRRKKTEPE